MLTIGDRDPRLPSAVQAAHDAAVEAGLLVYRDPRTGGIVPTALRLRRQLACCGNGCRHCPFPAHQQRASGRALTRDTPVAPAVEPEAR